MQWSATATAICCSEKPESQDDRCPVDNGRRFSPVIRIRDNHRGYQPSMMAKKIAGNSGGEHTLYTDSYRFKDAPKPVFWYSHATCVHNGFGTGKPAEMRLQTSTFTIQLKLALTRWGSHQHLRTKTSRTMRASCFSMVRLVIFWWISDIFLQNSMEFHWEFIVFFFWWVFFDVFRHVFGFFGPGFRCWRDRGTAPCRTQWDGPNGSTVAKNGRSSPVFTDGKNEL